MASRQVREPGIKDFIQAGYPALFLRTVEPEVAEVRVLDALKALNMPDIHFGTWRVTTGLMVGRADGTIPPREQGRDLIQALSYIEKSTEPIVAVLHNCRQFVANYQVIQHMVDAVLAARKVGSHLIMVGPHIDLPPELKNLVTFVDVALPDRATIEAEYTKMVKGYKEELRSLPHGKEVLLELIRASANAAVGLDMIGAENAIALSFATADTLDPRIIQSQKEQEVRKSDVLEFFPVDETMDDVGGAVALKGWLAKRRRVFSDEAREYGLSYPKGMLIVGPAGTGKSLTAKAIAQYLQLPLLRMDMGKVFRSLVGESESAIRMALQVTEAVSPVVLWIDEIEKGMAGMSGSGDLDSGVTSRVVSTILTWRQETKKPVVLVATANNVATLPSMVYRKGRLDEVWATDLPNEEERAEIFTIHLRKRHRDPEKFNVKLLAQNSNDYVGAEIESVIEDAMFAAFDEDKEVTTGHVLQAIKDTVPQAVRDPEELRSIRDWVATRARLVSGGEKPTLGGPAKLRTIRTTKGPKGKGGRV